MLKFRRKILQGSAGELMFTAVSKSATFVATALLAAACAVQPTEANSLKVWLMGEVHDNPQVHEARYTLIADKVKAGWRPAIPMEQFDREHQGLLRTAQDACTTAA